VRNSRRVEEALCPALCAPGDSVSRSQLLEKGDVPLQSRDTSKHARTRVRVRDGSSSEVPTDRARRRPVEGEPQHEPDASPLSGRLREPLERRAFGSAPAFSRHGEDAGGGTRTPDTRIMIPHHRRAPSAISLQIGYFSAPENTREYAKSGPFRGRSGPTRGRTRGPQRRSTHTSRPLGRDLATGADARAQCPPFSVGSSDYQLRSGTSPQSAG
jgi:hypothetical protein